MPEDMPSTTRTVLVKEIMTSPVLAIRDSATVSEAAALMLVNRTGSVIVIDDNGDHVGILTERMILPEEVLIPFVRKSAFRLLGREIGDFEHIEETMDEVRGLRVRDVMNKRNPIIGPDTHIAEAAEMMAREKFYHLCVVQDGKPVGVVSRHDLLRLFLNPAGDPVRP